MNGFRHFRPLALATTLAFAMQWSSAAMVGVTSTNDGAGHYQYRITGGADPYRFGGMNGALPVTLPSCYIINATASPGWQVTTNGTSVALLSPTGFILDSTVVTSTITSTSLTPTLYDTLPFSSPYPRGLVVGTVYTTNGLVYSPAVSNEVTSLNVVGFERFSLIGPHSLTFMVSNTSASAIGPNTATANASVMLPTVTNIVYVFWGTADGGTNKTSWSFQRLVGSNMAGNVACVLTGLAANATYFYTYLASNSSGQAWAVNGSTQFRTAVPTNDVTFFFCNDMHFVYNADITQCHRMVISDMNSLPGTAYPAGVGGGVIDTPRSVLVAGDVTESGAAADWITFTNWYGLTGTDGFLHYPVCEGWGNHDSGTAVKGGIAGRNPSRSTFLPNLSIATNGYHYSWDWDNVHFVHLNKYPGTTDTTTTRPEYSYAFLEADLQNNVGVSGRPVILVQHYGVNAFGLSWWPAEDQTNFYNLIRNYNVIGIIHGHSHGEDVYKWNGIDVFNAQSASGKEVINPGYMVGHVTSNKLVVAGRIYTTNTATWAWSATFQKTITNTLPPAMINNGNGASNATTTTAVLTGNLLGTNASPTYVWIYWGTTDGGTNKGAWTKNEDFGAMPLGFLSRTVSSLLADTQYYYRCYASNSLGSAWAGVSASFSTKAWIEVDNSVVSGLTTNSAIFNGTLVQANLPTNFLFFYWGTTDGGTNKAAWSNLVSLGICAVGSVSTNRNGLAADTLYYYRVYGTNAQGEDWAPSSISFQTYAPFTSLAVAKELLVELVANKNVLTNGTGKVTEWTNLGTAGGVFTNAYASTLPSYTTVGGTKCLTFNGVDDALESSILSPAGITGNSDWTVEIWAYNPSILSNREFMFAWSHLDSNLQGAAFSYGNMRPGATPQGYMWDTAFSHYRDNGEIFANGAPPASAWHHIAYTFSNTLLHIYVDGIQDTEYNFNLNLLGTKQMYIGGALRNDTDPTPYYYQFSGSIASIRVHDGELSCRQIANNYMGGPLVSSQGTGLGISNGSGANGVTTASATLNGTLISTGATPAYVYIFWGTADGGTSKTSWTTCISMGPQALGAFSTNIAGLSAESVYYYACYASNTTSEAWATPSASFTTLSGKPAATNLAVGTITLSSAVFNGNLLSTGAAPTTVLVYWGTNDGGTVKGNWGGSVNMGVRGTGAVSTNMSGLASGTTYYYKHCATNAYGETWASGSVQLTTSSATVPFVDITNANATVDNIVTSYIVGGTNNIYTLGAITWTNTLGGSGSVAASSTGWTFAVSLANGANQIIARGTNSAGTVHSDTVTVTRLSNTPTTYNWSTWPASAGTITTNWNLSANWSGAGFPNAPGDRAIKTYAGSLNTPTLTIELRQDVMLGSFYNLDSANMNTYLAAGNTLIFTNTLGSPCCLVATTTSGGGVLRFDVNCNLRLENDLVYTNATLRNTYLRGQVTGSGKLTLFWQTGTYTGGTNFLITSTGGGTNAPNTYSGGTELNGDATSVTREVLVVDKQSALGTGNVWLNPHITLRITDGGTSDNRLADTASLFLSSSAGLGSRMLLDTSVNETVGGLFTNGVALGSGTYGATGSGAATIMDQWFSGSGLLTVSNPPANLPFVDVTNANATVTYDETTYTIGGTNNVNVVGGMRWTNSLTGVQGNFSSASSWTVAGIGLGVGVNSVTVYGTNAWGAMTNDTVVIVRSAYAQSNVEKFEASRGADYSQVSLSWSNGTITVLACTNRSYTSYMSYWFTLTNGVSSPWTHTAATNFASVYYRIVSGPYTSAYDVGKFDVDIAAGSISWLSFPFAPQPGCNVLSEWFGQQLEARNYNAYSYPMLQRQYGLGGSIITRSYYIDNLGGGTTNWFPSDDAIIQNAGYVLFLAQNHPAVKLTSLGMVPTNGVTLEVPYQTIAWIGLSYPSSVDLRNSGITNLFNPPQKYSLFNYDFVNSQEVPGGPVWYAEYFIDDWGGGTTNFFVSVTGADRIEAGKGYLLFFSTTRMGTGTWTWVKPY